MLKLLTDENFDNRILRGVKILCPQADIVRVQDIGLQGAADPYLLELAVQQDRVLLTQDANTMIGFAYERVDRGQAMAGVVVVSNYVRIADAIKDIVLLIQCGSLEDCENKVQYLPI